MLRPLALARFRVILLPRKFRPLPLFEDILNQIRPEGRVQFRRTFLVRAGGLGEVLDQGGKAQC